jgi:multidrug transporter EmrE-like cation transporter
MTPIYFGISMATVDILMMGTIKMVSIGSISRGFGIPFAVGLYALQPVIFWKAMSYEGMAVTNLIWNMISSIIITLQGVFIFGESIKGMRWLAIMMSVFSLILFAYTNGSE